MKTNRGFTLVEVLAVTVLMTILLGALYAMVNQGLQHWYKTMEQTELRNGANLVLSAVQSDLLKAKRSSDGQDAVYVSPDKKELRIVTKWEPVQSGQPATPKNLIIYTIQKDPATQLTKVYRHAGLPPTGGQVGMQLGINDLDFGGSEFELQGNGRVLVSLSVKGLLKNEFHTATSFRYVYGS